MTGWLDAIHADPRSALIARGYGAAFELVLRAAELGDVEQADRYDEEWSRTLPRDDGRVDDLEQLRVVAARRSAGEGDDGWAAPAAASDRVRLLRAVYRFGALAWLMRAREGGRSPERAQVLRMLAAHFRDSSALAFVAGEALAVAGDRRLTWWRHLLVPKRGQRVVVASFDPTLHRAFVTLLMDAAEQGALSEIPPEPWIEGALERLLEASNDAWPLSTDPSWWDGADAEAAAAGSLKSRVLTQGRLSQLADRAGADRRLRIAELPLLPQRRERLAAEVREIWARRRTAGIALMALELSQQPTETLPPPLKRVDKIARSALVGEASERVLTSYAQRLVRALGLREDMRVRDLLAELPPWPGDDSPPQRVRDAIAQLRGRGMAVDVVLVSPLRRGVRELALEAAESARETSLPDLVSRWRLLGRIDGAPVVTSRAVAQDWAVVLSARCALASAQATDGEEHADAPCVELSELQGDEAAQEVGVTVRAPFPLLIADATAGWRVAIRGSDA